MQEIWKDIPNYEGLYQVSNLGRVKSTPICKHKKPRILKNIPRNGYFSVILCDGKTQKNVFVHRLVAECFVPNPENKPIVNHIDGNKSNPHFSNLEWCTQKENVRHAWKTGLVDKEKKIEHMRRLGINKIGLIKRWGLNNKEIIGQQNVQEPSEELEVIGNIFDEKE